jgi:peptide chain release factor 1
MRYLRARLLQAAQQEAADKESAARKSQVGTGERAEKIRTYNFPENRVTDHRVKLTVHRLPDVLEGDLDAFVEALNAAERADQLARGDDEGDAERER